MEVECILVEVGEDYSLRRNKWGLVMQMQRPRYPAVIENESIINILKGIMERLQFNSGT